MLLKTVWSDILLLSHLKTFFFDNYDLSTIGTIILAIVNGYCSLCIIYYKKEEKIKLEYK